jgi:hypothetical protein
MTFDWATQRATIVSLQDDLQAIVDAGDAEFNPPPSGVHWSASGVANNPTISSDGLTVTSTGLHVLRSTISAAAGYGRVKMTCPNPGGYIAVGLIAAGQSISSPPNSLASVPPGMFVLRDDGVKANNGASAAFGPTWAQNDDVSIAWKNGKVWFGPSNAWIGDPDAGTGEAFSGLSGDYGICVSFMGGAGRSVLGIFDDSAGMPTGCPLLTA